MVLEMLFSVKNNFQCSCPKRAVVFFFSGECWFLSLEQAVRKIHLPKVSSVEEQAHCEINLGCFGNVEDYSNSSP